MLIRPITSTNEILKQVKEKGAALAKRIVPVGLKVATAGILDLDYASEQALSQNKRLRY